MSAADPLDPRSGPAPMTFRLPAEWTPIPVPAAARASIDYAAVHSSRDGGFTPNITLSHRPGDLSPERLADEAVAGLRAHEHDVVVRRRAALGPEPGAGLAQELTFTTQIADRWVPVTQQHIVLTSANPADPGARLFCVATLTATTQTAHTLAADFRNLIQSLQKI